MVKRLPLKVASIFQDLVCSVYVVTITTGVNYSFTISFKSGFYFPDLIFANHELVPKYYAPRPALPFIAYGGTRPLAGQGA